MQKTTRYNCEFLDQESLHEWLYQQTAQGGNYYYTVHNVPGEDGADDRAVLEFVRYEKLTVKVG